MKKLLLILLLIINITLFTYTLTASVQAKTTSNNEYKLEKKNHNCKILVYYPETIYKKLNKEIKKQISSYVSEFKKSTKGSPLPENFQFSLTIFYETYEYDNYLSYVFHIEDETGGAHPNHRLKTIVYDTKNNKIVTLEDLIKYNKNILTILSKTSRKILKDNSQITNLSMLYEGTSPEKENFSNFVLTKDGLDIFFPRYQIAPYSSGTFKITIPYKTIKN